MGVKNDHIFHIYLELKGAEKNYMRCVCEGDVKVENNCEKRERKREMVKTDSEMYIRILSVVPLSLVLAVGD